MKKVALATLMIEKRIAHADHVLTGMPGERQLAEELGMSRRTIRTAVQELVTRGVLIRHENGRLDVPAFEDEQCRTKVIGFATAAMASADIDLWREGVVGALEGQNVTIRPVAYSHWADPALQEALLHLDGVFLLVPAEKVPSWLTKKIVVNRLRVVILDQDESHAGLPSVTLFPPTAEDKLFDHLVKLGHQRIDCLNTQAEDAVIKGRIAAWREYLDLYNLPGQLRSLTMYKPLETAYRVVRDALKEGEPVASALFCTTGPAAMGAMRALHEAGLEIGVDVSVCAVNGEGLGQYLLRSLTELASPSRTFYLRHAAEWMIGKREWQGPLLIQPTDVQLFEGESTGPAPVLPFVTLGK
ncbi:hypothetical protein CCAX7_36400 [Capsulimonas corticalis]|uniref:Uncharacterized protein n=1 Tax=Capsulimonas corticalis TaxID=2219043 RepID=A0A402D6Y5_9BACT|nr:substrate-binding domain-containing protein [Capsulimonas corticalis]BDI31589.1 hypothetical protein CCAX7_36400 [Capsulimonas corticalis]